MESDYVSTANNAYCDGKLSKVTATNEILEKDENILSVERWPPYGEAASSSELPVIREPNSDRIVQLESEKEQLTSSLFALTSRFAQVQFRLQQIQIADSDDKPYLLQQLNEIANKGCVEISKEKGEKVDNEMVVRQQKTIKELKTQLDDLESLAYRQGGGNVPQSIQLQKQQRLLSQIATKLNIEFADVCDTDEIEIKAKVDTAVAEIVNPGIVKSKLVDHLQQQIQDLERFVQFLQVEHDEEFKDVMKSLPEDNRKKSDKKEPCLKQQTSYQALSLIKKAITVMHIFSTSKFSCGINSVINPSPTHSKKRSSKQMLNKLKQVVNKLKQVCTQSRQKSDYDGNLTSSGDSSDFECETRTDKIYTKIVRKELCSSLVSILNDGLVNDAIGRSFALVNPISCIFPKKTSSIENDMHIWEFLVEYYKSKNGASFSRLPSRMLSKAFNLEEDESCKHTTYQAKRSLLEAINQILTEHRPLKRSNTDMFKALVCIGLNSQRLSQWIHLVWQCTSLVSLHYDDNSYVAKHGIEAVCNLINDLDQLKFKIPHDLATRPFKNIRDAF